MPRTLPKVLMISAVLLVVAVIGMQLVPVWLLKTNPSVTAEPKWDSEQTRALAKRACFDCHSNETVWPWYSNVAPVSWLIIFDTQRGRNEINFSQWASRQSRKAREAGETVRKNEMPPPMYLLTHPEAKLTDAEKQQLIEGLGKSLK
ncbi:MAG: heme-binding domain-containing protein [Chloroflexi bacterium]|nr:heme-binding domain-containing protein [Chloroflexota bacterium]